MVRWFLVVVACASVAHADASFVVHPTDGGLEKAHARACGEQTRDELAALVSKVPTIRIVDDTMVIATPDAKPTPAQETYQADPIIGSWCYASANGQCMRRMLVSIGRGEKPVIEISLIRRNPADAKRDYRAACYEKWQGTAVPQ